MKNQINNKDLMENFKKKSKKFIDKSDGFLEKSKKILENQDDTDLTETKEWVQSLENVFKDQGKERAEFLLRTIEKKFFDFCGTYIGYEKNFSKFSIANVSPITTPYINTIKAEDEPLYPGDLAVERSISTAIRWNAIMIVLRANKDSSDIGGHIATYASAATLYDVGYNHFFRGPKGDFEGDSVFFQGHASPGIYARAFIEGRLNQKKLENFRRELKKGGGLPSYPHPRLAPEFWQFPTVSMGIGPLVAIASARFKRYMHNRKIKDTSQSHVYAFLGDGEIDEVETLGHITLAAREKLDNLTFVINCNLQRLDGPVRGNGKVIQELEGLFLGAGWNVIKVIWDSHWEDVLENDEDGALVKLLNETVDGEIQRVFTLSGAERRKEFFSKCPKVAKLVEHLSDEELEKMGKGGLNEQKVYAAYHRATTIKNGRPSIILAHTIKGYGMNISGEGRNVAHQQKKMSNESLEIFKKQFDIPVKNVEEMPFYKFDKNSAEMKYIKKLREERGPMLPLRNESYKLFEMPEYSCFEKVIKGSGERKVSTTMALVQVVTGLLRSKNVSRYIVPIIPDESRTFGMEGLFRQYGIFSVLGQLYTAVDKESLMAYTEAKDGQIYQEGVNEAGAMATFMAAGTAYSTHQMPMIPFYIYYSMFGFQRVGDMIWAACDMKAKGFLVGGTAGRTTLNGEGLQHEDGHSHVLAATMPSILAYDPAFGYEIAIIVEDGIKRMYADNEDVLYYITIYNENYRQPAPPRPIEEIKKGIVDGIYLYHTTTEKKVENALQVSLLASGISVNLVIEASKILKEKYKIETLTYSVTSFKKLRDEALLCERENFFHPDKKEKKAYVTQVLEDGSDLYLGVSDYMRLYVDLINRFVPGPWFSLGTDGYGRSSSREELRHYFETDEKFIVLATLYKFYQLGKLKREVIDNAFIEMQIDKEKASGLFFL